MELEKLFLKKEEIPILYKSCFQIPIHPELLNKNLRIDNKVAQRIFPEVAQDWHEDLKKYIPVNQEEKEWINQVYLKEKPKITTEFNNQFLNGFWTDYVQTADNGLVTCFSINRNAGGSLYFQEDDINCESFGITYIKFSDEKKSEFQFDKKLGRMYVYAHHNVDSYPGALFLRNWAIKYMNKVFKQIYG